LVMLFHQIHSQLVSMWVFINVSIISNSCLWRYHYWASHSLQIVVTPSRQLANITGFISIHPSILHVAMVGTGSLWPVHHVCFLSSMLMPVLVGYIDLIYESCKGKSKFQIAHELGEGIYVSIKTSSWVKVYRFCKIINPIKGKSKWRHYTLFKE
jgi:hypothetical protein